MQKDWDDCQSPQSRYFEPRCFNGHQQAQQLPSGIFMSPWGFADEQGTAMANMTAILAPMPEVQQAPFAVCESEVVMAQGPQCFPQHAPASQFVPAPQQQLAAAGQWIQDPAKEAAESVPTALGVAQSPGAPRKAKTDVRDVPVAVFVDLSGLIEVEAGDSGLHGQSHGGSEQMRASAGGDGRRRAQRHP
jgi:hypothetical protein